MTLQIMKAQYQDMETRIRNFLKANNKLPNYCVVGSGNTQQIMKTSYLDDFRRIYQWLVNHNALPNYVTDGIGTCGWSVPQNFQDNKYTCGPTSLSMGSCALFKYVSESDFAKACGTNTNGTDPANLVTGAAKMGFKLTVIPRNRNAVQASLALGRPVVAHIQTDQAGCLHYINNYGHFVLIKAFINGFYVINDPTKGENLWCTPETLDAATDGRNIHYYSMSLA